LSEAKGKKSESRLGGKSSQGFYRKGIPIFLLYSLLRTAHYKEIKLRVDVLVFLHYTAFG
jgi:hypothetical protein